MATNVYYNSVTGVPGFLPGFKTYGQGENTPGSSSHNPGVAGGGIPKVLCADINPAKIGILTMAIKGPRRELLKDAAGRG